MKKLLMDITPDDSVTICAKELCIGSDYLGLSFETFIVDLELINELTFEIDGKKYNFVKVKE